MRISEICINRPVFATVISLLLVLIGAVSYTSLSVREYPRIDTPVVTVTTRYAGASAEVLTAIAGSVHGQEGAGQRLHVFEE